MAAAKRDPVTSAAWPVVAALMNKRGWRQKELADAIDYSVPTVSRWLAGIHEPEPVAIAAVADALEVSIETLGVWNDAKTAAFAQKEPGVTGDRAGGAIEGVTSPDQPAGHSSGGTPQEVTTVDKPTMVYNMLRDLPRKRQEAWYRAIAADVGQTGKDVPHPAARSQLLRGKRR